MLNLSILKYNAIGTGCSENGLYYMTQLVAIWKSLFLLFLYYMHFILHTSFFNNSTSSHKEVKNEEQKKRVEKKNAALNAIRGLIINSSLISKDAKEERLTEVRETITLQPNKVELLCYFFLF